MNVTLTPVRSAHDQQQAALAALSVDRRISALDRLSLRLALWLLLRSQRRLHNAPSRDDHRRRFDTQRALAARLAVAELIRLDRHLRS